MVNIGLGNGLLFGWCQAINWTNTDCQLDPNKKKFTDQNTRFCVEKMHS